VLPTRMAQWLRRVHPASMTPATPSDGRRAALSSFFLLIVALITLVYGLLNWFYLDSRLLAVMELAVCAISLMAMIDLHRHHNVQRACWITVLSAGGLTIFYYWHVRGDYSASVWTAFFALVNFFLLGTRKAVPLYLAFSATVAALILTHRSEWPALQDNDTVTNALGSLVAFGVAAYYQERSREKAQATIQELADTDSLTGIANRRHFVERFAEARARLKAHGQRYAFLLADIDHFKRVNDAYGHATGDAVIIAVTRRIAAAVRTEDLVGRLGGEEFGILLMDCEGRDAEARAESIRQAIADQPIAVGEDRLSVTVSIGIADGEPRTQDFNALFLDADQRLYMAKEQGRNRVVGEPAPQPLAQS